MKNEKNEKREEIKVIYDNFYYCERCKNSWQDIWSCACDDECSKCGDSISPYKSNTRLEE